MNTKGFIRKNILAVLAVALITGFSAFKAVEKATLAEVWFLFDSPLNPGDAGYEDAVTNPDNYIYTEATSAPDDCEDTERVCAVKATPDSNQEIPQSVLTSLESDLLNPGSNHPSIAKMESN